MATKTKFLLREQFFCFVLALFILVPNSWVIHARATCDRLRLHIPNKRQAEFASTLTSYDVITPMKVSDNGDFLSHNLHHTHDTSTRELTDKRKKRDVDGMREQKFSEDFVHYSLSIDGKDHLIQLEPNHAFLATHAVVERRGGPSEDGKHRIGNVTSHITAVGRGPRCHYVGHVFNHTSSKVALSTCGGLTGFVRTDVDEFLIEPLKDQVRTDGEPHSHLVYRKSDLHQIFADDSVGSSNDPEICSSRKYDEAIEERSGWEQMKKEDSRNVDEGSAENRNYRRKKRSVSLERNVEVLVVADKKMIDYYTNEDLNTYILTVMNMVSSIFHDASIGNAVNIVIVRIMLLETPQYEEELDISHDADDTLGSFCKWQQMVNPPSEDHPHHHDVAVLLTRYNICSHTNEHCSTLGLAEIAGMCQPHRSCNVNEDTGLQIAYTIAHEIGHNFAMNHDGPVNGCGSEYGVSQHVMSPHLASDSIPITWSNCSRNEITRFLDREWGVCLVDEPQEVEFNFPQLPPGAMYDASHQCRLIYGPTATQCDGMDIECDTLWCKVQNRCVTRLEPAAEGTQCGKHKWCSVGKCVTMGDRPTAIHGSWGQWSSWSSCSRSCGAGVETATRHCNNPSPSYGGKYCTGDRKRYRICNTQECDGGDESFRARQCSQFDNIPYKGHNYTWRPVTLESSPCQLYCKPDNEFYSVQLKDTVTDGTPCRPGTRDMCIHGVCKNIACDWTIDGTAQEDRCGLCHGDGTQCVTTKGTYNVTIGISYVPIVTFPIGARNVRVEELGDAANYLAMKDEETGKYHLNGNWIIQWSGEYSADGVMIYYKRDNETESLFLPGPLKRTLVLTLLFQTKNPGLQWEYTLPHENATYTPEFHWEYSDWSVCSRTCGGGIQLSKAQCMEKEAGLVDDSYCKETQPKGRERECNTHACPAWWWSGPWQPCSVSCGEYGTARRTVICVRSYGPTEQMALLDSDCVMEEKPHEEEPCQDLMPCPNDTTWSAGHWIESCRGDPCEFERREVKCRLGIGKCNPLTRPTDIRQCGNITCGHWEINEWTQCSVSCGEGVQIRDVFCVGGSSCVRADEPGSVKECKMQDCPAVSLSDVTIFEDKAVAETVAEDLSVTKPEGDLVNYPEKSVTEANENNEIENKSLGYESTVQTVETKTNEASVLSYVEDKEIKTMNNDSTDETSTRQNNEPTDVAVFPKEQSDSTADNSDKFVTESDCFNTASLCAPGNGDVDSTINGSSTILNEIRRNHTGSTKAEDTTEEYQENTATVSPLEDEENISPPSTEPTDETSSESAKADTVLAEVANEQTNIISVENLKNDEITNVLNREVPKVNNDEILSEKSMAGDSLKDDAAPDGYYESTDADGEKAKVQPGDKDRLGGKGEEMPSGNEIKGSHEENGKREEITSSYKLKNKSHKMMLNADAAASREKETETEPHVSEPETDHATPRNATERGNIAVTNEASENTSDTKMPEDENAETMLRDYDYYNEFEYDYGDHSYEYGINGTEINDNATEVERPQGFIDDKINVDGVQVIEIIRKNGKKAKRRKNKEGGKDEEADKIKRVKIHTGADAINVLNKYARRASKKTSTDAARHRTPLKEVDSDVVQPDFRWTIGPWSKCSEPCGGGTKLRAVECHNATSDRLVPPWKCHLLPPPDLQHCNMFPCLNWTVSNYGPCSAECGEGVRTRSATCPDDGKCHPKSLPTLHEKCMEEPCMKWVEGPWSMCTKACGGGYQIRYVKCVDIRTQEASQDCVQMKPPHKKTCNEATCTKASQSQQNHCKDHLDEKLCRRLVHLCHTKLFRVKCCRTCHRKRG